MTEIAPENGEGFYSLGLLLAEQNRLAEAETILAKAQSLSPDNTRIAYNRGLLLLQLKKTDEAEQLLIRAYQRDQSSVDILHVLVNISVQKREYEKALGRIQMLQRLEPDKIEWGRLFQEVHATYEREKYFHEIRPR